jgi:signal transduction histidine kinase
MCVSPLQEYDDGDAPELLAWRNRFVRVVKRKGCTAPFAYSEDVRRWSWHLAAAGLMLVVLGVLATLQYRWLGEVSRAERERLGASLRARAADFAADFDRDLTRLYALLQVDAGSWNADAAAAVGAALARAAAETNAGRAISASYVVESGPEGDLLRRYNQDTGALEAAEWPPDMAALRRRLDRGYALPVPELPVPSGLLGDALDPDVPALIVPIAFLEGVLPTADGRHVITSRDRAQATTKALVARLDLARLREQAVAPLVSRHFGGPEGPGYLVSVVRADGTGDPVYRSDAAAPIEPGRADVAREFFALRLGDLRFTRALPPGDNVEGAPSRDRVAITIVRRGTAGRSADGPRSLEPVAAWQLLVQARRGSLDAIVSRSRVRNMAISLGVLALLGASVGLVLIAAAREQRAARQQIEFVASVSHELRTPLAVIRSAAENLADGVVSGGQVAEYGALIRNEGRRLSDMVERVMAFAGLTAGTAPRTVRAVSVRDVLADAVAGLRAEARERRQSIAVTQPDALPRVSGNADALRSALQNAIGNALKYSSEGATVDVTVTAGDGRVSIAVSDRGLGIDPDDLPRVFAPFFRGRRAVASQVRGSGIGLSVVQKVVHAHGGKVRIANRDGGGTVLSIDLPAVGPETAA